MKTWSIAGALDGLRKLEKLTRPPKMGHDVDVPVDAADALADREAEEEVGIGTGLDGIDENLTEFVRKTIGPMECCGELWVHAGNCPAKTSGSYGIKVEDGQPYVIGRDVTLGELHKCTEAGCICQHDDHYPAREKYPDPGTGCINDGAPQQVTLSGREYERYLDGALNASQRYTQADVDEMIQAAWAARDAEIKSWTSTTHECIGCGEKWTDEDHEHDCPTVWADLQTTTLIEPVLSNNELVAIRQLIEERFGDQTTSPAADPSSGQLAGTERLSDAASAAGDLSNLSPAAFTPGAGDTAGGESPPGSPPAIPNLEFPDPAEMHLWPDWLLMMHAANCLEWPRCARLVNELRIRSHKAEEATKR